MAEGQSRLDEELERCRKMCESLRLENVHKEETIAKLKGELKSARINSATPYVYDAVIDENGVVKRYSWKIDHEALMKRRREALERHRLEYENRVGATEKTEPEPEGDCYDELDGIRLQRG